MQDQTPCERYEDIAGGQHQVLTRRDAEGAWQVVDVAAASGAEQVIETLTDPDDGGPQAEAIAREYAHDPRTPRRCLGGGEAPATQAAA